jgi:hypothetical protein
MLGPAKIVVSIYPRLRQPNGKTYKPEPIWSCKDSTGTTRWVVDNTAGAEISIPEKYKKDLRGNLETNIYEAWVHWGDTLVHRGLIDTITDEPGQPIEITTRDWSDLWGTRRIRDDIGPPLVSGTTEGTWDVTELFEAAVRSGMRPDWHEPNPAIVVIPAGIKVNASIAASEARNLQSTIQTLGDIIDWAVIGGTLYVFGAHSKKTFQLSDRDFVKAPKVERNGQVLLSDVTAQGISGVDGRITGFASSDRTYGLHETTISSDYPDVASANAGAQARLADSDRPKIMVTPNSPLRHSLDVNPTMLYPSSLGDLTLSNDYMFAGTYDVRLMETRFQWRDGTETERIIQADGTFKGADTGISLTLATPGSGYYRTKSRDLTRALPGFLETLDSRLTQLERGRVDGKTFDGTRKQVDDIQKVLTEFGIS